MEINDVALNAACGLPEIAIKNITPIPLLAIYKVVITSIAALLGLLFMVH